jgi:hypothetical protein
VPLAITTLPFVLACRVFGHRFRFSNDGPTMRWRCQRDCGAGGEKQYGSPEDAERYAAAFDREDRDAIRHSPVPFSLLPLRLFKRRERR